MNTGMLSKAANRPDADDLQAEIHKASLPQKNLSVLVLSPDPRVHGGVSVFAEMMKANLKRCRVTSLWVGSIQGQDESMLQVVRRILAAPFATVKLVRRQHFDVVHINPSLTYKSTLRDCLILLSLRLAGFRRTLFYFHGWDIPVQKKIAATPGLRQLFVWLMNGTGHIMVLAPEFKQSLIDMGVDAGRITFTRTMFDGGSLKAAEALPRTTTRRSILFMSRFVTRKGVYELLEAFSRMAAEYPDVDLIMAGDGEEMEGMKAKTRALGLAGRVRYTGYVSGLEKTLLLRDCTLCALPTYLAEGMPVVLLEAMGAGKPLLTAKAGAIRHIIFDPDNGVVLDNVTADTVETGLRRLLGDAEYCQQTGRRNAEYAWKRFEAASVTAEIEALYGQIAAQ